MKDFKKSGKFGPKSFGPKKSFGAKPFAGSTERFQATCNQCHKLCEVPFRPNGKKPVYCRDCFKGKEDPIGTGISLQQFALLNAKLDRLIKATEAR